MWRHITGVEQPAKKIKLDNNEKLERKRTYDQVKRKRKFQTNIFIMFHTYDIPSYDPTDAINLWNLTGQRTRRPSQRPYGSRQDDGDAGDDDVSSDDNTDILSSL
jgi:hypothetical protein